MDQSGIIRDLLAWLESHLDHPLSLDNVAAKAGYSKWHLQRMFKEVTGHAIGLIFARAACPNPPLRCVSLRARFSTSRCNTVSIHSRRLLARLKSSSR